MNITILQGAFLPVPPLMGGAVEQQWFQLGQEFARRGHGVRHLSRQHPALPDREMIEGVEHVRIKGAAASPSTLLLKLRDLLFTLRARRVLPASDIIVTNTFWAPILFPAAGKGQVYVDFQRMPKGQVPLYLKCARLRGPSRAVIAAIHERCPKARPLTAVIPNFLPISTAAMSTQPKERRLLYAGRVHPEKGLELLLEAFQNLAQSMAREPWQLDIVGPSAAAEGGGGEHYLAELKARFTHPSICWHGPVFDRRELSDYYQRASIFCYPSLAERGETFGVAPLEAMAHGTCPVVSALSCFADFIRHGENGLVFDHRGAGGVAALQEALRGVMEDDEGRERLAAQARAVRESHALEKIASLLLEDFQTLLTAGRPPAGPRPRP